MTTNAEPDTLDRLADDAWDALMELHPLFATTLGDRRFDTQVPIVTPDEAAIARTWLAALRRRLDDLGAPGPGEAAVTASALRETLDGELAELDSGMLAWTVNPLDGLPTAYLD